MSIKKSQVCNLPPETKLIGKWHKRPYKIVRELGNGATGTVYLAQAPGGLVAVKMGLNSMAITSEVNVLKHFSKVQGQVLGPSLIDVDDWVTPEGTIPFYAMEYLKGQDLFKFVSGKGSEWIGILMVQLLGDLDRLHQAGWVFGDLKPDNLIIVGPPARIRWLDVGGTTLLGRSIKEYTEFYDRGYWGLGTRRAEPTYDLFAVAMIIINICYQNRFEKNGEGIKQLRDRIQRKPILKQYETILLNALQGKYPNAQLMKKDVVESISRSKHSIVQTNKKQPSVKKQNQKQKQIGKEKSSGIMETFLFASFLLLAYILYLFGQMM
ncbi:serine/threonine protein kinase [Anaerobacillus isosaccharinicus]|uniref:Serine/threonine protein kinase n=1 Tax=Anaerobacillus isosaccharinicus TaxID=1532552 RepID=A0A7S7LAG6_9BACI|nr:protein kinase family protein [Anaerobacillus isosaccharinicus]MBA5584113.1 protein kinase family protein [Anaerobacillus isosaccharinicus]QOY37478.1 protein kinase family protein [Anaerobacillus isosaccharinicus]